MDNAVTTNMDNEVQPTPKLPPASVLTHITDVHCHPTDAPSIPHESVRRLPITICAMSSNRSDQEKVKNLALANPSKVIPAFGYHPWFSHSISLDQTPAATGSLDDTIGEKERHYRNILLPKRKDGSEKKPSAKHQTQFDALFPQLPDLIPLSSLIAEVRANLLLFPDAMLGEVGLDKIFRVPFDYFAEPRVLSPFNIAIEHQLSVIEAQLDLAVELRRNVSMHSVKCPQATVEILDKMKSKHGEETWYKISVDMHSCGLSPETWRDLENKHANLFLSFSDVINSKHSTLRELLASASADRILVESDYNDIDMVTSQTWEMVKFIAEVRGWLVESEWDETDELEEKDWGVVRRLEKNWLTFKRGNHPVKPKKLKRIDYSYDTVDDTDSDKDS